MQEQWILWERIARRIDGALEQASPVDPHTALLTATIDGNITRAGVARAGRGTITWVESQAPYAVGLRMAVSPMDRFPYSSSFAICTGDPDFDGRFDVRTSDAPYARMWLDEGVRAHIADTTGYHFVLEGGRCRVWRSGLEGDADNLIAAVRAAVALGNRGAEIRRGWEHLARSLGGRLLAGRLMVRSVGTVPSIAIPRGESSIRVDGFLGGLGPRRSGRGVLTRVRCRRAPGSCSHYVLEARGAHARLPRRLPPHTSAVDGIELGLSFSYRVRARIPDRLRRHITRSLARKIRSARPELVVGDAWSVTLFFLGFETSPARLRTGVEIVSELAGDAERARGFGLYR